MNFIFSMKTRADIRQYITVKHSYKK